MSTARTVAVTGALGNVGSIVVRHLRASGYAVIEVDVRDPEGRVGSEGLVRADLTSYEETRSALDGADTVVHLAGINAPIFDPPWRVHNVNVTSSYNVLSAAVELGIHRVVQSSSVNAIGLAWSRHPSFDYFPIDTEHRSRIEDPYSLSKLAQELQADSLARRYAEFSAVSLRLHAVLRDAQEGRDLRERLGDPWAINGLFGYCTYESVVSAVELSCLAEVEGHEVLLVAEPDTFVLEPSAELAATYYPTVPQRTQLSGHGGFFDTSRTETILGWRASTASSGPLTQTKEGASGT
jgi:nucleoside-diphosphate-sugar epimerase